MTEAAELLSGSLQTERLADGTRKLLRELIVRVGADTIVVPEGFVTDYSSIPWFGRSLVRWSRVDIAGVVHDFLYQSGQVSRERADEIWRITAMSGEHSANAVQAWLAWAALRVGGSGAWNSYRSRSTV
ncbi:MAG: DUF1353 domain-containing protein [Actinomycetia bacterium]|nr:DUF1353 domain-containing protein [Actinomycetes bacterium]